ncbi:MAG: ubiquitin-like domain-containing protein [Anaerolineae bacterium]
MFEPSRQPDDTQPNRALTPEPSHSLWSERWRGHLLLGVIMLAALSLIATLTLTLTDRTVPLEVSIDRVPIILRVAGEQHELETNALTVGDVLIQEGVRVSANDAVSPAPETAISADMVITVARSRTVTLMIDEQTRTLETPHEHPAHILQQAEVSYAQGDRIWLDGTLATISDLEAWPVAVNEITLRHAHEVRIVDGEDAEAIILLTTASTVGDALFEAGVDVFLTDTVTPDVNTPITADIQISIDRARPLTIAVDGEEVATRVQGETVADALSEAGIALVGMDYTIPAIDALITPDMTRITVLRVTENIESSERTIPFETVYQADNTLELDQQQVIQSGRNGIERSDERVRFENEVEVSREPLGTEITQAAQNQVIAYGTNVVLRSIDTPDGPREYWRAIRAYATSYHPEALGGDNITALGMELQRGIIASNPDIIPYRTNLYVPGYGTGIMADTGGPRSSPYWVDLGYSDADWVSWSRYVDVYLLTPVPAEIDYLLPNFRPMRGQPDN